MNRRDFAKLAVVVPSALFGAARPALEQRPSKWPESVFRRFSVDIHVPDWDPRLLGRFDASKFVAAIADGGAESFLMFSNSHAGPCLWRTKIGRMHGNMKGRGEVVRECRRRGIHPLAYFSVIFDNWNYEQHPDWRIETADGQDSRLQGRYGVVCPNSGYRDYVLSCIRELVEGYDIDHVFFDMTFWPGVCYCSHCTARFLREEGSEPPRIVNWDDPLWRKFQAARQRWLLDFANTLTSAVKAIRPITCNHQYSTIFHNWTLGTSLELARACDFVGGDFYGGPSQQSLACKVYHGSTPRRPFEFHTSRTRIYTDHVTVKPADELRVESYVATAHSAALMLVDYINVDGTLNPRVYEYLGTISRERAAFEPYLGGELVADVAVYYDKESMYNPAENGVHVSKLQAIDRCPHRDAVLGVVRNLQEAHIPFGVVTNANIDQLNRYRALILPSVLEMTSGQAGRIRKFVEGGGGLYASAPSSLDRLDQGRPRLLLEVVLGVRHAGTLGTKITYLTPRDPDVEKAIWPQDHLSFPGAMAKVEALQGAKTLATVTLPFVPPEEGRVIGSRFAAIHSNPPALEPGKTPAIVVNRFGTGRTVWVAAPIESTAELVNQKLFLSLLRQVITPPFAVETETHPSVEVVVFHEPKQKRLLASLLSLQKELPRIAVPATVRLRVPEGRTIQQVVRLPARSAVPFEISGPHVQFRVESFDTFAMLSFEYA